MFEIEAEELPVWFSSEDRSRYAFFLLEMVTPFDPAAVFPPESLPDGEVGPLDVPLKVSFSGFPDEDRITFRGAAAACLPRPTPADLKLNLGLGAKLDLNSWSCSWRDLIV